MPLAAGTRLSVFEILAPLGKGGMGEVYRAKDTKLEREIAVKILPEDMAKRPDRMARFDREAKLLAALDHPHIAAIHGLHEEGSQQFLVMELVDGETLADRLTRGPLPVEQALELGRQIAEALEAAHDKDIIHRDLKPSNVMLTSKGQAKVLDFGLGRVLAERVLASGLNTETTPDETGAGVVMGTAPYMSPEQARGDEVDHRTDIWSLGCVLYETLAGRRAFPGRTTSDTIVAVLDREPDWKALPEATPLLVRSLLRRCLKRDQSKRLHDIADARIEIEEGLAELDGSPSATASSPSATNGRAPTPSRYVTAGLGALVGAIAVGATVYTLTPEPPSRTAVHFREPLPVSVGLHFSPPLAISPDGARMALAAGDLHLRSFEDFGWSVIPETRIADMPFFSPDGEWIGYFENTKGELRKVKVSDGVSFTIGKIQQLRAGATWGPDDTIVFGSAAAGLSRIPAGGGASATLTTLAPDEDQHWWPQFLPDGSAIVFTVRRATQYFVALADPRTGSYSILEGLGEGRAARYVETGHLVYVARGQLLAAAFDVDRLEVTNPPVPVSGIDDVYVSPESGLPYFSISREGHLAYLTGVTPQRALVLVDREGVSSPVADARGELFHPRFSPDGTRIAVGASIEVERTWIYDPAHGTRSLLTARGPSYFAQWGPEPGSVTFTTGDYRSLHWKVVGTGGETPLLRRKNPVFAAAWSPGGAALVFEEIHPDTQADIWVSNRQGEAHPLLVSEFAEFDPDLSPDGQWLAYASNDSGRSQVYVDRFPDLGERVPVSVDGGAEPVWSPDGDELFYRSQDRVMAVSVQMTPSFRASRPRLLFRGSFLSPATMPKMSRTYDVAPDGDHFLMLEPGEAKGDQELRVVLNSLNEIEKLAPRR